MSSSARHEGSAESAVFVARFLRGAAGGAAISGGAALAGGATFLGGASFFAGAGLGGAEAISACRIRSFNRCAVLLFLAIAERDLSPLILDMKTSAQDGSREARPAVVLRYAQDMCFTWKRRRVRDVSDREAVADR